MGKSPIYQQIQPTQPQSTYQLSKKKSMDFTDYAYREAVGRLKMMLAEPTYTPHKYSSNSSIFKSVTDDETDTDQQTIVERPAFKEVSKFFPQKSYHSYSTASSYKAPTGHIASGN